MKQTMLEPGLVQANPGHYHRRRGDMKQTALEPGVLRVIQLLTLLLAFEILLIRRPIAIGLGIDVSLDRWLLVNLPVPLFLLAFTWIGWWHRRLGWAYLPLTLLIASLQLIVAKYLTVAWIVPPAKQELDVLLLMLELWLGLHAITLLVAWHYSLRWVFLTSLVLSVADGALSLPFITRTSPLYILFVLFFTMRTVTVTLVALGVGWLLQRQREQQQTLAEANLKLANYAATAEQLAASQERNRLARELHDTLAHSLSGVTVQLEAVEALWEVDAQAARKMLDQALHTTRSGLTEARRALQALRASPLDDLGLALAVGNLAESVAARASLKLELDVQNHLDNISPEVEQCVYRVAQEALTNVVRHADARALRVALARANGQLTLTIADDGRGFDPEVVKSARFGLKGLRERAELIGGHLDIQSKDGLGTTVRLEIRC